MPFDGSGNFTRNQNFVADRDAGIRILASHVDDEFDNFMNGMNSVFLRDGSVAMTGNLKMGSRTITGLPLGSLALPALASGNTVNTGIYFTSGGATLNFANSGVASGSIGMVGATFPNVFFTDGFFSAGVVGTIATLNFASNDYLQYDRTADKYSLRIAGVEMAAWDAANGYVSAKPVVASSVSATSSVSAPNVAATSTLTVTEIATPASPGAGKQFLFIDSADHKLKRKDSGGTVTIIA